VSLVELMLWHVTALEWTPTGNKPHFRIKVLRFSQRFVANCVYGRAMTQCYSGLICQALETLAVCLQGSVTEQWPDVIHSPGSQGSGSSTPPARGVWPIWGKYEASCLLGCDDVYSGRQLLTFWRNVLPPSSEEDNALRTTSHPRRQQSS
jgi:hypothetical protein